MSETIDLEPTDFIRIDEAPVPARGEAFFLPAPGGARLRVAAFPVKNAKGTVALLTGWSEFMEKYVEVVAELQARGFNVAQMDWRGQGLSSRLLPVREKGHIQTFGTHEADLKHFARHFVMKKFAGPYFVMAHSMGGNITLNALAGGLAGFEAAVLCSPMTRIFPQTFRRLMVKGIVRLGVAFGAERVGVPSVREMARKFEGNTLTHDEIRHTRFRKLLEAAPDAALNGPTFGWVKAATDATEKLTRPGALKSIRIPVKIISAEEDSLVDTATTKRLAAAYSFIDHVTVPGAYHEILMEEDSYREEFWRYTDRFIDEHFPKA